MLFQKINRFFKHSLILCIAVILSACAAGRTMDYHTGTVNYNSEIPGDTPVIVAFQDIRPYVLSGNKDSTFVGLQRSLTGIPYPVNTKSGQALANDFSHLVSASLRTEGVDAKSVVFPLNENFETFVKENITEEKRFLIFSLKEWKIDIYTSASLHYDVTLSVYAPNGTKLASAHSKGVDALGTKQPDERKNLAAANIDIMGGLLQEANIKAAIVNGVVEPTANLVPEQVDNNANCSVQQVLSMKNSGLTDEQISNACK